MGEPRTIADLRAWVEARLPDDWFSDHVGLAVDREEIVVVGTLPHPDDSDCEERGRDVAVAARVAEFREATRRDRMRLAEEAEMVWGRKLSWGVCCGGVEEYFTTQAVPVMTRLRMPERAVLDTLIDAGVARSRSEALAWCVRLVGTHEADWIAELRAAVERVAQVRASGPGID